MRELNELRAEIKLLKDSPTNTFTTLTTDLHGSHGSLSVTSNTTLQPTTSLPPPQTNWKTLPNYGDLDRTGTNNGISTGVRVPTNSKPSHWSSGYGTITKDNFTPNDRVPGDDPLLEAGSPLYELCSVLMRRLNDKRASANRPEDLHLMTPKQIEAEKLSLQKALLYFESLHGRPKTRQERFVMRPLYDRYRTVKRLLSGAHTEYSNRQMATSSNLSDAVKTVESEDHLLSSSDVDHGIREEDYDLSKPMRQPPIQVQKIFRPKTTPSHPVNVAQDNSPAHPTTRYTGASFSSGDEEIPATHSPHSLNNTIPEENPHPKTRLGTQSSVGAYHHPSPHKCSQSTNSRCSPNGDHHRHRVTATIANQYTDSPSSDPESSKPIGRNSMGKIPDCVAISLQNRRAISSPPPGRLSTRTVQDFTCTPSPDLTTWTFEQLQSEATQLRSTKRDLQKSLKGFEHNFERSTGHKVERADRLTMRAEYNQYKYLKTRLGELERELNSRLSS